LEFANGALGNITCSTAIFPGELKRIEINGTIGTAVLQESNLTRWEFQEMTAADEVIQDRTKHTGLSHGGGASNPADISFKGHQLQIEDLLHAISTDGTPLVDAREGRKAVEIVLAVYKSAQTGSRVELPLA
jgi:predicted dehydrogenase